MNLDRTRQPLIRQLDNFEIIRPERLFLSNGIPLNVLQAGSQDVVRLDLLFEGGSWQQTQKLQALFTNRMLREGTKQLTAAEIAEKLDYYGAWLELATSAEFSYVTLYSLNKCFEETLAVVESIVKEPLFPEKELNTVVESNVQQYLINQTKVDFLSHRSILHSLFGDQHPCGTFATEDDFRRITPAVLRSFYQETYRAEYCSVYISGKVTDEIIKRVEDAFGSMPFVSGHSLSEEPSSPLFTIKEKRIFTEQPEALQSSVKLGLLSITRSHPDYLKLRVLVTILGGYFGSRLMSNIREEKGYTYGISAGQYFYPGTGIVVIATETDNDYVEPLIREVYAEIDRLQNDLVSKQELSVVKNYMLGDTCRSYESPFSLSDAWMFIQTTRLQADYFSSSVNAIKDVTPEELRDLACRYLCKESLKEVVVGKKSN
ncbi:insulinase family protein [Bacteroides sp. 214]|uniref:M16 family metallopeptidase n=1 Tax=Bacteroides sp. 214 TaxID=2302935 RepID=UPI0013D20C9B|nr:pitrilysin family protein [Bacteroides sp. 214]NDW11951.1 insulinase family protein [Bacteroides sp. 214]